MCIAAARLRQELCRHDPQTVVAAAARAALGADQTGTRGPAYSPQGGRPPPTDPVGPFQCAARPRSRSLACLLPSSKHAVCRPPLRPAPRGRDRLRPGPCQGAFFLCRGLCHVAKAPSAQVFPAAWVLPGDERVNGRARLPSASAAAAAAAIAATRSSPGSRSRFVV